MAKAPLPPLDTELAHLKQNERWRTWMARVEAVLFQSSEPIGRETLARVIGPNCNLDLLIDDIRDALASRPYEIVRTAGGYLLRTRAEFGDVIHHANHGVKTTLNALSTAEGIVLMTIAYFQPITRTEIGWIIGRQVAGREVDRECLAKLRRLGLIANGPRSAEPGAPTMYVTTARFLAETFYDSLADLPDRDRLEAAGMINKAKVIAQRKAVAASLAAQDDLGEVGEEEPAEPLADFDAY